MLHIVRNCEKVVQLTEHASGTYGEAIQVSRAGHSSNNLLVVFIVQAQLIVHPPVSSVEAAVLAICITKSVSPHDGDRLIRGQIEICCKEFRQGVSGEIRGRVVRWLLWPSAVAILSRSVTIASIFAVNSAEVESAEEIDFILRDISSGESGKGYHICTRNAKISAQSFIDDGLQSA